MLSGFHPRPHITTTVQYCDSPHQLTTDSSNTMLITYLPIHDPNQSLIQIAPPTEITTTHTQRTENAHTTTEVRSQPPVTNTASANYRAAFSNQTVLQTTQGYPQTKPTEQQYSGTAGRLWTGCQVRLGGRTTARARFGRADMPAVCVRCDGCVLAVPPPPGGPAGRRAAIFRHRSLPFHRHAAGEVAREEPRLQGLR